MSTGRTEIRYRAHMRKYPFVAVVALAFVLTGCGPTPATDDTPVAESSAPVPDPEVSATIEQSPTRDDPAAFTAPAVEGTDDDWRGVHFVSPDGNEGCAILGADAPEPGLWGCALVAQDWSFPRADPADYCYDTQVPCGYGIEVTGADVPHPRRRGDPGFPAAVTMFDPGSPQPSTLAIGHSVTYGDVACVSATEGIRCDHAASGHGFTVSKTAYELH